MNSVTVKGTVITLLEGDITGQDVDAIVNAANPTLTGGGGVDGAIHNAGGKRILLEGLKVVASRGLVKPGQAVMTGGGNLKARFVIHAVGPTWQDGMRQEAVTLASAYTESLKIATAEGLETVAFPSISTGAYGYPVDRAAMVAIGAVYRFLKENETSLKEIRFVLYSPETFQAYARALSPLAPREQG